MNKKMFLALFAIVSLHECVGGQVRTLSEVGRRAFSAAVSSRNGLRSITYVEAFMDRWAGLLKIMQTDLYSMLGRRLTSGKLEFTYELLSRGSAGSSLETDDLSLYARREICNQEKDFLAGKQWLTENLAKYPGALQQAGELVMSRFDLLKNLHLLTVRLDVSAEARAKAASRWKEIYKKEILQCAQHLVSLAEGPVVSVPRHPYIIEK